MKEPRIDISGPQNIQGQPNPVDVRDLKMMRVDGSLRLVRVGPEESIRLSDLHAASDRLIESLNEDHFPPQGEPGGDEPELTRAEADERERSSHTHP